MNNIALLRNLIIYAVCLPLAVFIGYQLTEPQSASTYYIIGLLVLGLSFPILLRWHHFIMIASWNAVVVLFFLPGSPQIWLIMVALSFGITLLQRSLNHHMRFIHVPQLTLPLICLAVVVIVTAELSGGIGLRSLGSEQVYGGKRYVFLLMAIVGYFALTAHRIPRERAGLYVGAFFLLGLTGLVGDLFSFVSPSLYFVFLIFPPNLRGLIEGSFEVGSTRLGGAGPAAFGVCFYMLARYGIRGILDFNRPWRLAILVCVVGVGLLAGYRSIIIILGLTFIAQFFFEGWHKTKALPVVILAGLLGAAVLFPLASKLPYMAQRVLTVVPFLELNPLVRMDAESTVEWRFQMWKAVTAQIPRYFWLGKGYALSALDFDTMNRGSESSTSAENWQSAIVGDYHNGPLSVILPFGIWGVLAFLWFTVSALRVLYLNHRHGPPELRNCNTLLLSVFVSRVVLFFFVGGGLHGDMMLFTGLVGLSVSINGGVCKPVTALAPAVNKSSGPVPVEPRPRTLLQH